MAELAGVKLTSVTIDAASPDVIGALMKEITDRVIAAIPDDTLANIAAEAISSGVVLRKRDAFGRGTTESFVLSDEAREVTIKTLSRLIDQAVAEHLAKDETKAIIAQLVEVGIAAALKEAPNVAAQAVAKRMAGAYIGGIDEFQISSQMKFDSDRVSRLIDTLFQRGVIPTTC